MMYTKVKFNPNHATKREVLLLRKTEKGLRKAIVGIMTVLFLSLLTSQFMTGSQSKTAIKNGFNTLTEWIKLK